MLLANWTHTHTERHLFVALVVALPEVATYLCPNSCVIVWESMMPLSSLTLHDCFGLHMPPTFASPSVLLKERKREREITLATATKREAHSHAVVATNVLARDQYGHVVMMRILLPQ